MLTGNELFVIIRLVTGEQVMSALENEDENYVQLLHPMLIRTVPNFQTGKEMLTASPFCAFSDDESYIINKKNILFIKRLSEKLIPHYMNVVQENNVKFVPKRGVFDHPEETDEEEPEEREESNRTYVEGNDTKH